MQITLVAIIASVAFLSIPKTQCRGADSGALEFDALCRRKYANEEAHGRFDEDQIEQIRKTLQLEGDVVRQESTAWPKSEQSDVGRDTRADAARPNSNDKGDL